MFAAIFKVFFSNIFIEFLLDLELCSVPLQNSAQFLYCLENPPVESRATLQEFLLKNITDWSNFPFYFLLLLRTSREKCPLPSSEYCYAIYTWCSGLLKLRLTCNHSLQGDEFFSSSNSTLTSVKSLEAFY